MSRKIKDKSINLDPNVDEGLTAIDISYTPSQTVKDKLDKDTLPSVGINDSDKIFESYAVTPDEYGNEFDGDASPSGVINEYTHLTADVDQGSNTIVVSTVTSQMVVGREIMLHQTQCYRNISYKFRYEFVKIQSINGNMLILETGLKNEYLSDTVGDKVNNTTTQVVTVPHYNTLTVNTTIVAGPWDGESGGILAFRAKFLAGTSNLSANGRGFRGGLHDAGPGGGKIVFSEGPLGKYGSDIFSGTLTQTEYQSISYQVTSWAGLSFLAGTGLIEGTSIIMANVVGFSAKPYTVDGVTPIAVDDFDTLLPMMVSGVAVSDATSGGWYTTGNTSGGIIACFVEDFSAYSGQVQSNAVRPGNYVAGAGGTIHVQTPSDPGYGGVFETLGISTTGHTGSPGVGGAGGYKTGQGLNELVLGFKKGRKISNDYLTSQDSDVLEKQAIAEMIVSISPAGIDSVNSEIVVNTSNGHGSTNTKIRRFSNIEKSIGIDISYLDSPTDGASFTINKSGLYAISYMDVFVVSSNIGISRNSSELTTNVSAISINDRLMLSNTDSANGCEGMATTLRLDEGDVIRPHTDGAADSASVELALFRIIRIGDLESAGSFTKDIGLLSVYKADSFTINLAARVNVLYDQVDWDLHNAYNPATGEWIAPKDMKIRVTANVRHSTSYGFVYIAVNHVPGVDDSVALSKHNNAGEVATVTKSVYVNRGDTVSIYQDGVNGTILANDKYCYFQIEELIAGDANATDKGTIVEFTNADLVSNKLIVTHDLGQTHVLQAVKDNEGDQVPIWPKFLDRNTLEYDLTGITVLGTWSVVIGLGGRTVAEIMTAYQKDVVDADYYIIDADGGKAIDMDSAVDRTVYIQNYATEPITRAGQEWTFSRLGIGQVSISAPVGVTLNGVNGGITLISVQWDTVLLRCKDPANNIWIITGRHSGVS